MTILDLYPYVSQFPDLLCNIASSVTGLRKIRFNGYTLHRVSTKNQFPKRPGFPFSALIILDSYPYVSQFPDLLCNIASSVTGLRKILFNGYTLHRVSTKKSVPKETRISIIRFLIARCLLIRKKKENPTNSQQTQLLYCTHQTDSTNTCRSKECIYISRNPHSA